MKTLEENRYRKLVNADARRVAWFVNNSMSEDYDTMPESMRKKWVKAEYKKERYLAKEFMKSQTEAVKVDWGAEHGIPIVNASKKSKKNKKNEGKLKEQKLREMIKETIRDLMEAKQIQFQIPYRDQKNVMKILRTAKSQMVGKYKEGTHYDFGVGKGATFILDVDKKLEDEILSLLIQNGIRQIRAI